METALRAGPGRRYACTVAWDPAQYLKFADQRLRPAVDLLNRIDAAGPVGRAYTRRAGGRTLLPFRRLFIVATARQG